MGRVAPVVPSDADTLCESCGYTLNGLPEIGNCPECGRPIAESSPTLRDAPPWEQTGRGFFATTREVLFHPARFYRGLATREGDRLAAARFASWHFLLASLLFSATACAHVDWMLGLRSRRALFAGDWLVFGVVVLVTSLMMYFVVKGVTRLAASLTAWEAAYRGFRLSRAVVLRGMNYHAAHYVPVVSFAFVTVWGYQVLVWLGVLRHSSETWYLGLLCAEVIVGATFLFYTYWIAMRNMMYANR
ncbi:MAG: hypothetical protein ACREJC_02560 [Tepidisphaeraceae bacterium]